MLISRNSLISETSATGNERHRHLAPAIPVIPAILVLLLAPLFLTPDQVSTALAADMSAQSDNTAKPVIPTRLDTLPEIAIADTITGTIADTLDFIDVDTSLLDGHGVLLAFEDTIPFAVGTIETLLVSAKRMSVAEVVRLIGERMEADRASRKEHSFTAVTKAVIEFEQKEGEPRKWETYEEADRMRFASDASYQTATLWKRERKYEGNELVEEKVDEEIDTTWDDLSGAVMEAIPFSLQTGHQYHYAIVDRKLLGMNVVYEVRYEPKSKFKALPKGRVWLDTSDFVIRRVEAEMTDAVPMPMFIKEIPVYKLRRIQKGEHWVLDDVYAKVNLRDLPFFKIPASLEFYMKVSRHVINGVEYPDGDGEP